jgi:Flp pilus assembly CpaF family ATPase
MSYELILPFFPEELRELLLDPSISDLMINGTTGVFADRNGIVEHIELRAPYTNERLQAAIERVARILGPYRAESDSQYALARRLARSRCWAAFIVLWPNAHRPQIQPLVYLG